MAQNSPELLDELPERIAEYLAEANRYMLEKAGDHINRLGHMLPSDVHRLEELRRASADIRDIEKQLSERTELSIQAVRELYDMAAANDVEAARNMYEWRDLEHIPYAKNEYLQRFVQSISRRTEETLRNLSQTTVLNVWKDGKLSPVAFADAYKDIIDKAVTTTALGVSDYGSAMRSTLRTLGESGLRNVEYESGYTRRLDSAVRMNLLEGIRQINQGVQDSIGEEIESDGVEISAHGFCAPDHEDIQGKQLTDAEFARWTAEHAYPRRKIGVLNCRHIAKPIILGITPPAYSPAQLEAMKRKNAEGITFEGKHYTGYEATQMQRKLETAVRYAKDKSVLAAAAGDDVLRREAQREINLLKSKYKKFSDAAGLSYKSERMSVSGYHPVKVNAKP